MSSKDKAGSLVRFGWSESALRCRSTLGVAVCRRSLRSCAMQSKEPFDTARRESALRDPAPRLALQSKELISALAAAPGSARLCAVIHTNPRHRSESSNCGVLVPPNA